MKPNLDVMMAHNREEKFEEKRGDFFTQTSKIISNHLIDFRQILIDFSDEFILIINIHKAQTKLI